MNPIVPSLIARQGQTGQTQSASARSPYESLAKAKSRREALWILANEVSNQKQPDGRINMGLDPEGRLSANMVSPYSALFWDNIEPKIKSLVKALRDKRHLPVSSCEGHGWESRRYVSLAFATVGERARFKAALSQTWIPGLELIERESLANERAIIQGGLIELSKEEAKNEPIGKDEETFAFNVALNRSAREWLFLDLVIMGESPSGANQPWRGALRRCALRWMKCWLWDWATAKAARAIERGDFPAYRL